MTLDEAIKHCEEVADEKNKEACNLYDTKNYEESRDCIWCAEEHRQLAKWLKELKAVREAWLQLTKTVLELRDNNGTGTQQEVCKFLADYLWILKKDIMAAKGDKV